MAYSAVIDTFSPTCRKWAIAVAAPARRQGFFTAWGAVVANQARKTAFAKGGRRLWRDIARSIRVKAATGEGVEVGAFHVAAAQKQFGGPIKARGKAAGGADYLTIPVAPEAEGQTASRFALPNTRHPNGTGPFALFVFPNSNLLGYMEDGGSFHPLFALVRETKPQPAEPWWPEADFIERAGVKTAEKLFK